jgi:hypothetical protein
VLATSILKTARIFLDVCRTYPQRSDHDALAALTVAMGSWYLPPFRNIIGPAMLIIWYLAAGGIYARAGSLIFSSPDIHRLEPGPDGRLQYVPAFRQFQLDLGPIGASRGCESRVLTGVAKPHYAIGFKMKVLARPGGRGCNVIRRRSITQSNTFNSKSI